MSPSAAPSLAGLAKSTRNAVAMPRIESAFGKVLGQIGLRCMNGGRLSSMVKNAVYP